MPEITLTRADLTRMISEATGFPKSDCKKLLEDTLIEIISALNKDEGLLLTGFGKFSVWHKKRRMGRDPRTGLNAVIPARRSVTFVASPALKRRTNDQVR